jgi:hypothetical protein
VFSESGGGNAGKLQGFSLNAETLPIERKLRVFMLRIETEVAEKVLVRTPFDTLISYACFHVNLCELGKSKSETVIDDSHRSQWVVRKVQVADVNEAIPHVGMTIVKLYDLIDCVSRKSKYHVFFETF